MSGAPDTAALVREADERSECAKQSTYGSTCEHTFCRVSDFCDGCVYRLLAAAVISNTEAK